MNGLIKVLNKSEIQRIFDGKYNDVDSLNRTINYEKYNQKHVKEGESIYDDLQNIIYYERLMFELQEIITTDLFYNKIGQIWIRSVCFDTNRYEETIHEIMNYDSGIQEYDTENKVYIMWGY